MMPTIRITHDLEMHYVVDDFTDPWSEPETVMLLHGNAESGAVWFGWVPHLARHFRVVRPDMRGFGKSTPVPRDYPWSIDAVADDYVTLMEALGIDRVHLVAAKIGGTVARHFAARHPDRVRTLTVVGTPKPRREDAITNLPGLIAEFEKPDGIEAWVRRTMKGRLGSKFPDEGADWWIDLMAGTPQSTQLGFMRVISIADITDDLPRITCPTLVITTERSALGTVEETRQWQQMIPRSTLLVLPGDSYHVAASDSDRCARETLDFITGGHKKL